MRQYLKFLLLVLVMEWCFGGMGSLPAFSMEDAIIAVVNDDLITLKDFKDYLNAVYIQLKTSGTPPKDMETIMKDMEMNGLERLIENKLLVSEANRIELTVNEEIIDDHIEEVRKQYPSEKEFIAGLIQNGLTISDLKKKLTDQMKANFIIDREVRSKIFINPQEVTAYYENHRAEFHEPERVNLDSIFIPWGDSKEEARRKANEAYEMLKEGEDFRKVAQEYSKNSPLGVMVRGQMLPEIERQVFQLSVDTISPILEVGNGLYIFKLLGRSPARIAKLEDVKNRISEILSQLKFKEQLRAYLDKLKQSAYIEIKK